MTSVPTSATRTTPAASPLGAGRRLPVVAGRALLIAGLAVGLVLSLADPFTGLFYASYAVIGAFLVIRRPRHPIGWLLLGIGVAFLGITTTPSLDIEAIRQGTAPLDQSIQAWASAASGYAGFTGFATLMILFPSGRFPGGRWRWPARAIPILGLALTFVVAFAPTITFSAVASQDVTAPNPFALLPGLSLWSLVPANLIPAELLLMAVALVSLLVRYRRSTGLVRQQLRWLVASLSLVVIGVAFGLTTLALTDGAIDGFAWLGTIVAFPMVPVSIGIAILRYRLYDIDRIISRTIGWALTTGLVAAVFGLVIVGLQALLAPVTSEDTLAVATSTLVAAALFLPLRRRVQGAVDRRFNRAAVDAQLALEVFGTELRDEVALDAVTTRLAAVVRATVQPSDVAVWTRAGGARP
jgi:hypothetical protein